MTKKEKIHIVAVCGSVRSGSNTSKVLALVTDELKKQDNVSVTVVDPNKFELPLPGKKRKTSSGALEKIASEAAGLILATPEYHGSYSSVMKLVIENLGYPSVIAGKPVALLGVASGQIGAIKAIEHLSSVCAHIGAIVLPGPVSVANVHKFFGPNGKCLDKSVEKRIRNLAVTLINYIRRNICPRIALEEMVRKE